MDLFDNAGITLTEVNQPDLKNWANYFSQNDSNKIDEIMTTVNNLRQNTTIYPEQENILKVFKEIHPDNLKVVIIGQDPYHDGNATGIAFGCKNNVSPSLKKIWEAILSNTDKKTIVNDIQLQYLVLQGVMLLNTTLTVEKGQPNSHHYLGWEEIIRNFIKSLAAKKNGLIFMLWGKYAQGFSSLIDNKKHLVLEASHPASAAYNKTKWNCYHFYLANEYLISNNKLPIKWR